MCEKWHGISQGTLAKVGNFTWGGRRRVFPQTLSPTDKSVLITTPGLVYSVLIATLKLPGHLPS